MPKPSGNKKLTDKQEKFCQEYLIDLNATQAAIRAGYSEQTANEQGCQNLAKLSIQERVAELQKKLADKLNITQEKVIQDILSIQQRCMTAEPVMVYDSESKTKKESGEYVFDSSGALKATEMLAKHIGFYEKDNKQQSGGVTVVQLPSNER